MLSWPKVHSDQEYVMHEHEPLGRRVVIKTKRKGHGGTGKERSCHTGKVGTLYLTDSSGNEVAYVSAEGPNAKAVHTKLRSTNLIPTYVTLKTNGETRF